MPTDDAIAECEELAELGTAQHVGVLTELARLRFEFEYRGRRLTSWLLIDKREGELCAFAPGLEDDLVVKIKDPSAFARWHLGLVGWPTALRSGAIEVSGPRELRQALPTWNSGPEIAAGRRAAHRAATFDDSVDVPSPAGRGTSGDEGSEWAELSVEGLRVGELDV